MAAGDKWDGRATCVRRRESSTTFPGDPVLPVPAAHGMRVLQGAAEEPGWQSWPQPWFRCAQQERARTRKVLGVRPSSSTPKRAVQRVGLSSLIPLDAKTRTKNKSGLETESGFKTKISDADCKNYILEGLLEFRALTWFTKTFGAISWLCITFLALVLGWGWVQKRC